MTNGEKIQTILDVDRDCTEVHGENGTMTFTVTQDFWNAEYKEPTTKNNLGVRKFEEIVVGYPPEELCIYPEYKGKPYFSIKYKKGNDYIIGYGTYNPKVLSRYLRDYFISPVTPQEPRCKDCKWWKDSDGEYRRGCGAESHCFINTYTVHCGEGYCYMFLPKADMREVEE